MTNMPPRRDVSPEDSHVLRITPCADRSVMLTIGNMTENNWIARIHLPRDRVLMVIGDLKKAVGR